MSRKWFFIPCAALVLSIGLTPAFADHDRDGDHGNGNGHAYGHAKHDRDDFRRDNDDRGARRDDDRRYYYRDHDRELHEWYRAHNDHLPPGLAKRDRLPPGGAGLGTAHPAGTCLGAGGEPADRHRRARHDSHPRGDRRAAVLRLGARLLAAAAR